MRLFWNAPFRQLVSVQDKLIQLKILHRTYFTLYRLHKLQPTLSSACWRCGHRDRDFPHLLDMSTHLLVLVGGLAPTVAKQILLGLLLFFAIKSISTHWKKTFSPPLIFWKRLVKWNLPLYRRTYENGDSKKKFNKVWAMWMDDPSSAVD